MANYSEGMHERELLARIFPLIPQGVSTLLGPGDDSAVVSAPDGRVVVSTDVLVEGRHFRRDWSTGVDVGWRAAVQNLADIAAMGAEPTAIVVALVIPSDVSAEWVEDLARGLELACGPLGVGVVGGDLSGGGELVVSVTVLGNLRGANPVVRSGASVGDLVVHAGVRGHGAAGYALLMAGCGGRDGAVGCAAGSPDRELMADFLRPNPPVELGRRAAAAGVTAMIDVSDGLLLDAERLAVASGVVIDVDPVARSFGAELALLSPVAARTGHDAEHWILTGGEDHGLLATIHPDASLPEGFHVIGEVRAADAVEAEARPVLVGGLEPAVETWGWDHGVG